MQMPRAISCMALLSQQDVNRHGNRVGTNQSKAGYAGMRKCCLQGLKLSISPVYRVRNMHWNSSRLTGSGSSTGDHLVS